MHALFHGVAVVPVLTIEREEDAVPLACALFEGGLRLIEVTLRTPAALVAIAAIGRELPQIVVGAGTVQRPADVVQACAAGARFLVSPGITAELAAAALATELPYLPGVATPSEVMAARDLGISFLKLFPAEAVGGLGLLRALAPVFSGVAFCPTGGIDEALGAGVSCPAERTADGRRVSGWRRRSVAAGDWRGCAGWRRAPLLAVIDGWSGTRDPAADKHAAGRDRTFLGDSQATSAAISSTSTKRPSGTFDST
jgi:2-dehydro-3-deoxyphosphogluconate aldolase/(4S)-4-hydroxy-2-oxoglutarate aldolase